MKTGDVQLGTYIEYSVGNNNKYPKLNVDDHVRMSKCKKFFADRNTQNCSGEVFVGSLCDQESKKMLSHEHTLSAILTMIRC